MGYMQHDRILSEQYISKRNERIGESCRVCLDLP